MSPSNASLQAHNMQEFLWGSLRAVNRFPHIHLPHTQLFLIISLVLRHWGNNLILTVLFSGLMSADWKPEIFSCLCTWNHSEMIHNSVKCSKKYFWSLPLTGWCAEQILKSEQVIKYENNEANALPRILRYGP